MLLPPLFPDVTCKGTWEGYRLTQKVISRLLLHSSQGALQDALPLILWNIPQSVILLPMRPASLTDKNPQIRKIIYGMHAVGHEIPWQQCREDEHEYQRLRIIILIIIYFYWAYRLCCKNAHQKKETLITYSVKSSDILGTFDTLYQKVYCSWQTLFTYYWSF